MAPFPHLGLSKKIHGPYKPPQGGGDKDLHPQTSSNRENRQSHGETLLGQIDRISDEWKATKQHREESGLPALPNPDVMPILLRFDAKRFEVDSLKSLGVEVISEEEDGYAIGASSEDCSKLRKKILAFIENSGQYDKASELWRIEEGVQERIDRILSESLRTQWDTIRDEEIFIVDVGIACYIKLPDQPVLKEGGDPEKFEEQFQRWQVNSAKAADARAKLADKRQDDFDDFIRHYQGEAISSYVDYGDSFGCRIKISGQGLKDIVLNYPFVFEVVEADGGVEFGSAGTHNQGVGVEITPPAHGSAKVCIIDSGIDEGHRLIAPAIDSQMSKSFIEENGSTADAAHTSGGHGTRVAGAALYPRNIPPSGTYQAPFFIQNAKVMALDEMGCISLPKSLFPPVLMEDIVKHFASTSIFSMSINSRNACQLTHMSQWAAMIDMLMYKNNKLFILSSGNIPDGNGNLTQPGIRSHLSNGTPYPKYLLEPSSRIANPAQSCFALTVGSVCIDRFDDGIRKSFGEMHDPSSFSRAGLGLWGMIKPDVVEYAGDYVYETSSALNTALVSLRKEVTPQLVKSGSGGTGNDAVGTSYAAPKVANIAAAIQNIFPNKDINLYRALIAQSARLPEKVFRSPTIDTVKHYGYGIPNLRRATENTPYRLSLIASDSVCPQQTNVYTVKIPESVRNPSEDKDILVEFTLSFMAEPRRTRMGTQSYLSSWLTWKSSKLNENEDQFQSRVIKDIDESVAADSGGEIQWMIRERKDRSKITNIRRQDSSLQKSWCVINSSQLPKFLSFAVIGHSSWRKDLAEKIPYSIVISLESLDSSIELYHAIRVENQIEMPIEVEQEIEIQ